MEPQVLAALLIALATVIAALIGALAAVTVAFIGFLADGQEEVVVIDRPVTRLVPSDESDMAYTARPKAPAKRRGTRGRG